jgi:electron transfer flavoprotein beta subunit
MKIVVLVKHVPESTDQWCFADDFTLDREKLGGRLSELDEYAVEQAVRIVENGHPAEITFLTVGPAKAGDALRKALAMGGDRGVHVIDEAIHGSDALSTSMVLAKAVERAGFDLVMCGMASTDAEMSVVPAMIAERLGVPQLTFAGEVMVDAASVSMRRDGDTTTEHVTASLPAVVSVTDRTGEARYPSFRAIMQAKKKPVETWSLADIGVTPAEVGLAAAGTVVRATRPSPPREAGTVVVDEGDGAVMIADFLTDRKFL